MSAVSTRLLVFVIAVIALVSGCSKDNFRGNRPDETQNALTVSQAVDPVNYGRTIRVKGAIDAICQEEGCWMVISDGSKKLRISFKDEAFTVPMKLQGQVLVEGIVKEELLAEDVAKAIGPTIGKSDAEIAAMSGDQRIPLMTATGVLFDIQ